MNTEHPHQRDLRKGRVSQIHGLYFVTKRVEKGHGLGECQRTDMSEAFVHARRQCRIKLHAFVVMPDHWHALFSLASEDSLSAVMGRLCRHGRFKWRDACAGGYEWQRGYYDHKMRSGESVVEIVRYIEANPVRRGLIESPREWGWSSANAGYAVELDREWLGVERWAE